MLVNLSLTVNTRSKMHNVGYEAPIVQLRFSGGKQKPTGVCYDAAFVLPRELHQE